MSDIESPVNDAKTAKADAKAAKARAKALRPWYKKKRFIGLIVIVAIVVIGSLSSSKDKKDSTNKKSANTAVQTHSNNDSHPPQNDVTITKCQKGEFGPEVEVTIVNHTSKTSNYLISLNLVDDSGTKVGEANGASNNVAAGQQAVSSLLASLDKSDTTSYKCVVGNVDRLAS